MSGISGEGKGDENPLSGVQRFKKRGNFDTYTIYFVWSKKGGRTPRCIWGTRLQKEGELVLYIFVCI